MRKIIAGLEVTKELMKDVDMNNLKKDCELFSAGTFTMAVVGIIIFGPKKWFKTVYSPKGLIVGLLMGYGSGIGLILKNKNK